MSPAASVSVYDFEFLSTCSKSLFPGRGNLRRWSEMENPLSLNLTVQDRLHLDGNILSVGEIVIRLESI